jgi:type II secretory pathway pseudopilin PulG
VKHANASAFTLAELMVVVAIIVLLLALLAPALDSAIYNAELAVCATRVRGLAQGATIYAADERRAYPARQLRKEPWRPGKLWHSTGSRKYYDERTLIRPYVSSINMQFQCPFLTEMDVDQEDVHTRQAGEAAFASYQFWYGWEYKGLDEGLFRLGDRFNWIDAGREWRFDVLANDYDFISLPAEENFAIGSHPDKGPRQVRGEMIANNEPVIDGLGVDGSPRNNFIWSRWQGPYLRSPVDMNFAHTDNSVSMLKDVVVEQSPDHTPDERMVRVPEENTNVRPYWRNHLPPSRQ